MDFKQQFGLDYLKGSSVKTPEGFDEALLAYGGKVMGMLKTVPQQSARLFDLAQGLSVRIDVLLPVMNFLVQKSYVERVGEDTLGNDLFRLTESGKRIPA